MSLFTKLDRHAGLVGRMADALGVDMAEEAMRGNMGENELRRMVYRCMGCTETDACEHFLDENASGADAAPGYCRNKEALNDLARR